VPLLSNNTNSTSFFHEGHKFDSINVLQISPGYFKTMEMPLVSGRGFTDRDNQTAPKVVVINETAARKFFPNEHPLGLRFGTSAEQSNQLEVVGVLRDAKYDSVRNETPPTMYVPFLQGRPATMFHVRTTADPAGSMSAIRDAVRQIDPDLPVLDVATQSEQIEKNLQQERMFAQAYKMFGGLAMLIASAGLFGLMSCSVSGARTRSAFAWRWARSGDVLRLVMNESMRLVALGVAIQLGVALASGADSSPACFSVPATDAPTIAAAMTVMVLVSPWPECRPHAMHQASIQWSLPTNDSWRVNNNAA
jgi:hypothetical protein